MDNSIPVWLLPLLSFIVGVIATLLICRMARSNKPAGNEHRFDELQQQFDSYQDEVVAHFSTTAELVNKLTENYQNVQEHLLQSAERLALDEDTRQRLLNSLVDTKALDRPAEDTAANEAEPTAPPAAEAETAPAEEVIEPPRDYASKEDGEVGTLDESFGLKKG